MHVAADAAIDEIRLAVEAAIALANDAGASDNAIVEVLLDNHYGAAADASGDDIARLRARIANLRPILAALPDAPAATTIEAINRRLDVCEVHPSLQTHDGLALHIHWTKDDAPFEEKVMVDMLMSLSTTIVERGTEPFGHCGADDCGDVFYDSTKNHSRRFCADPKCASRTHTSEHRRRQRQLGS